MLQALYASQICQDLINNALSSAVENAIAALPVPFDGFQYILLAHHAHSGKPANTVLPRSFLQLIQVGYIQLLMEHKDRLWA